MIIRNFIACGLVVTLGSCGGFNIPGFGRPAPATAESQQEVFDRNQARAAEQLRINGIIQPAERETIWDLFGGGPDENVTVEVNKYLWAASLDVLNFLPVQAADPFTGIIVTGYGTPPGGGRAYRATVQVRDPALDARSLEVALATRGGAVAPGTVRAVEDAILTRARQLRIQDSRL